MGARWLVYCDSFAQKHLSNRKVFEQAAIEGLLVFVAITVGEALRRVQQLDRPAAIVDLD